MPITAARIIGGPEIEEMERELTGVIEDFDRAVNVEALRRAKEAGKYLLSQYGDSSFSMVSCRSRASAQTAQARQHQL